MHLNTFFQEVPDMAHEYAEVVPYWRRSWQKHGWTTRVYNLADAQRHPRFKALKEHVLRFPTVNNPVYESVCWLRWLVAAQGMQISWWSDTDVINRGLTAGMFAPLSFNRSLAYPAHYFCKEDHKNPVAGILSMSSSFATRYLVEAVLKLDPDKPLPGELETNGKRHFSDMIWLQQLAKDGLLQHLAADIGHPVSFPFPLVVHCSYDHCLKLGKTKLDFIKEITA